jgi:tetratricopeptide (TPR) repeat protein
VSRPGTPLFLSLLIGASGVTSIVLAPHASAQRPQPSPGSEAAAVDPGAAARDYLAARKAIVQFGNLSTDGWTLDSLAAPGTVDESGVTLRFASGKTYRCRYKDNSNPAVSQQFLSTNFQIALNCEGNELLSSGNESHIKNLAAAWRLMASGPVPESSDTAAIFDAVAANFQAAPQSYALPEAVRELKVQAEMAVEKGRFLDAVDRFSKALAISPWWPAGHYNLALMYGELNMPALAVAEMKKYLKLVPQAPNARAAQDMIYRWRDPSAR